MKINSRRNSLCPLCFKYLWDLIFTGEGTKSWLMFFFFFPTEYPSIIIGLQYITAYICCKYQQWGTCKLCTWAVAIALVPHTNTHTLNPPPHTLTHPPTPSYTLSFCQVPCALCSKINCHFLSGSCDTRLCLLWNIDFQLPTKQPLSFYIFGIWPPGWAELSSSDAFRAHAALRRAAPPLTLLRSSSQLRDSWRNWLGPWPFFPLFLPGHTCFPLDLIVGWHPAQSRPFSD